MESCIDLTSANVSKSIPSTAVTYQTNVRASSRTICWTVLPVWFSPVSTSMRAAKAKPASMAACVPTVMQLVV